MTQRPIITPRRSIWTWSVSALAGAAGLAVGHGFREPIVAETTLRVTLAASIALFALSRLLMLVPLSSLGPRLRRWWVDFVLMVAAGAWWVIDHSNERVILQVAAIYAVVTGASTAARAGIRRLTESGTDRPIASPVRWLFIAAAGVALAGGAVLCLPVCWAGPYPVQVDHPSTYCQLARHGLDCLFTATAAITGTGLATCDIGYQFSRLGHIVILLLMQIGGLAILITGTAVGWRLRQMIGWRGVDDDVSSAGLRRVIRFVCVAALVIELAGTAVVYRTWDGEIDPSFKAAPDRDELLAGVIEKVPLVAGRYDEARLLASLFHAVSAFCNVGLTLSRDSLIPYRHHVGLYAGLLPLMVLGSIGGPVVYELCRRLARRGGHGLRALSKDTSVTLLATLVLIVAGAGLLFAIESTTYWQLRYPRDDTPGRLMLPASQGADGSIVFSADGSDRARSERMRTMSPPQRLAAAVFHSITARTGGMHTARLDESSLSPASRLVLMAWMLIGGAVGGSAGGLRILVWVLLIVAITGCGTNAKEPRASARAATRQRAILSAVAVTASMFTLIGLTAFTLVYRQAGSLEAVAFEAVSACCNVGFSTPLTNQLSAQGRSVLILAMLLGRVLPLGILLRCTQGAPIASKIESRTEQPVPHPETTEDAPETEG